MRISVRALAVIASLLSPLEVFAREPEPITKSEARSLPPSQVERRVMAQLSAILTEERWERRKAPVRPLTDMNFTTRPRNTVIPNLCRVDLLKVSFRPTRGGKGDADTPVLANGFSASHYFHFSEAPKAHFQELANYDREEGNSDCTGVSFVKDAFFNAPSEEVATDGYFLAHRVINDILGGKPAFTVECDKSPVQKDLTCADIVRDAKTSLIDAIEECESDLPEFALTRCYQVYVGDRFLRIVASPIAHGQNVQPPLTPLKVKVGELIILSHERVD